MTTYTTVEKTERQTGTMQRLNGGSLRFVGAAGQIIAQGPLNNPAGTVLNGVGSFAGFPKNVTPTLFDVPIAKAQLVDSAGVVRGDDVTVGLAGSGAEIIVSKLTPTTGDTINIASPLTLAHGA